MGGLNRTKQKGWVLVKGVGDEDHLEADELLDSDQFVRQRNQEDSQGDKGENSEKEGNGVVGRYVGQED